MTERAESDSVKEIREVRERIYEKPKDMTPEKRRMYFEEGSKRFLEIAKNLARTPERQNVGTGYSAGS